MSAPTSWTGGKSPGGNASKLHEHLLDAVRFRGAKTMREQWPDRYGGLAFTMMPEGSPFTILLPWSRYKYRPDVTAWFEHDGQVEVIAVEIGKINQTGYCPIVHMSLYGGVAIMDADGTEFEQHVLQTVRTVIGEAVTEWIAMGYRL